jgi:subtilisin family serine protease
MNPLDTVKLTALMEVTSGRGEIVVGLIDGSVATDHPDLMSDHIRAIPEKSNGQCTQGSGVACSHGTFIAGILNAKRGKVSPAICPNCTLLVRPIFYETVTDKAKMPSATPEELARAIYECVEAGAQILNLSAALTQATLQGQRELEEVLDYGARRGTITIVATGNQGTVGSSVITRHPGVIPVAACNLQGQPLSLSNLSSSIGRRGVRAPGENITSLGTDGKPLTLSGTSVAVPFVTGAVALLWSEFPTATAGEIKRAVTQADGTRRRTIMPPLLDAWGAYQVMATLYGRRQLV